MNFLKFLSLSIAALTIVGCTRSAPTQFYVLNQMAGAPLSSQAHSSPRTLGIGPVRIPKYLDQPQIVTREDFNQLHLDETHRWAEPLDDNISRVLGDNLLRLAPGSRLVNYPWRGNTKVDYQIKVDIRRFEMDAANNCVLSANWSIVQGKTKKVLQSHQSFYKIHTDRQQSYEQIANLMSRNLMRLSRDIAKVLN